MVNIRIALVAVKKKKNINKQGGTESIIASCDYDCRDCDSFTLSGQYPYSNRFIKIKHFHNLYKIKDKVDMRKIGYKGRIFYDDDTKKILKFESNEEIIEKYRDKSLLFSLAYSTKENITLPEFKWKYENDQKYEFQEPNRIVRDILKEKFDLDILRDVIKEYIENKFSEENILMNLKTYTRHDDSIETVPSKRPEQIFKEEWNFKFSDLTIRSKWIEFKVINEREDIVTKASKRNNLLDKDGMALKQNIKSMVKEYTEDTSNVTYEEVSNIMLKALTFKLFDFLDVKDTTRNRPFCFKLDNFDPEDIEVDLKKEKGELTIDKI